MGPTSWSGGTIAAAFAASRKALAHSRRPAAYLDGSTELHRSVKRGCLDSVMRCLSLRPDDVRAKDTAGETPLHYAASRGSLEVARLLLAAGADACATTDFGTTPLAMAEREALWQQREQPQLERLLLSAMRWRRCRHIVILRARVGGGGAYAHGGRIVVCRDAQIELTAAQLAVLRGLGLRDARQTTTAIVVRALASDKAASALAEQQPRGQHIAMRMPEHLFRRMVLFL